MVDLERVYQETIEVYESIDLSLDTGRRTAFKPLYDYYCKLLHFIIKKYLGIEKEQPNYPIKVMWEIVSIRLKEVNDKIMKWSDFINRIGKLRNSKIEHKIYDSPTEKDLKIMRDKLEEFTKEVTNTAIQYLKITPSFTVKKRLLNTIDWYERDAERLISTLTIKKSPEKSFLFSEIEPLMELKERILEYVKEFENRPVTGEDIVFMTELVKHVEGLSGIENGMISRGICPRCGDKIVATSKNLGEYYDDKPEAVEYFTGCEKCKYELNKEVVYL